MLLTLDNLANRGQYINARNTFTELLAYGTIPIVNENVRWWQLLCAALRWSRSPAAGPASAANPPPSRMGAALTAAATHHHQTIAAHLLHPSPLPWRPPQDTVAVQELRFGDNDTLSAQVATLVDADYLFLLTDVDALYTANPKVLCCAAHVSSEQAAGRGGTGRGGARAGMQAQRAR